MPSFGVCPTCLRPRLAQTSLSDVRDSLHIFQGAKLWADYLLILLTSGNRSGCSMDSTARSTSRSGQYKWCG